MKSLTNDNRFRLIIRHEVISKEVAEVAVCAFDSYGLVKAGVLPKF
jgi:hypothetical protein